LEAAEFKIRFLVKKILYLNIMSDVFTSNPPILMLEVTDVVTDALIVLNTENILYHQVTEGSGTVVTFIGGDSVHVKEELTTKWLRDNT
tara:strand:- start:180 stop:446 length:267 start_codon:yes stop_codon:yes gene_type:complete